MIPEEYTNNFFKLQRYVPYIKDEKTNIQRYVSRLPQAIEYNDPKTLVDVIQILHIAMKNISITLSTS